MTDRLDEIGGMPEDVPMQAVAPDPVAPEMHRFQKRPVMVEAWQWKGGADGWPRVMREYRGPTGDTVVYVAGMGKLRIPTLEGEHFASPGDWIIRGVAGELYPCKPEIFAQTYIADPGRPVPTVW